MKVHSVILVSSNLNILTLSMLTYHDINQDKEKRKYTFRKFSCFNLNDFCPTSATSTFIFSHNHTFLSLVSLFFVRAYIYILFKCKRRNILTSSNFLISTLRFQYLKLTFFQSNPTAINVVCQKEFKLFYLLYPIKSLQKVTLNR